MFHLHCPMFMFAFVVHVNCLEFWKDDLALAKRLQVDWKTNLIPLHDKNHLLQLNVSGKLLITHSLTNSDELVNYWHWADTGQLEKISSMTRYYHSKWFSWKKRNIMYDVWLPARNCTAAFFRTSKNGFMVNILTTSFQRLGAGQIDRR